MGGPREDLFDDVRGVSDLVEADEGIHFGHLGGEVFGKALSHAAGDDEFLAGAPFQAARLVRFEDGFDALLFRGVDESARIHDEHVGFVGVAGDLHAAGEDAAEHEFGIDEIFRAAEGDHADFFYGGRWESFRGHGYGGKVIGER